VDSSLDALESMNQMSHYQKVVDSKRTKQNGECFSLPVPGYDLSQHPAVIDSDIIHLHWVAGMVSPESLAALQKLDKPIVWTLHDQRPFTGGCHYSDGCDGYRTNCAECPQLQPDINHLAEANLANLLGHLDPKKLTIVSPSAWLAECARQSQAFRKCRVEVIPYGIEVDIFKRIARADALKTFSLPQCPTTFLFGAENILNPRKGINTLVGAIQKCILNPSFLESLNQGKLRFLTFGVNGAAFKNFPWIHALGLLNSDELMAAAYSASDAFICSSLEDNLPNTVLESMASGTPCIASRAGGIPDMITHGVDGWMFPVGDSTALAAEMIFFLKNPQLRSKVGLAAREKMESQFALEIQAKRYLSLYEELLAFKANAAVSSAMPASQVSKKTIKEGIAPTAMAGELEVTAPKPKPMFSVITAVRNAKKTFSATAKSVLDQRGVDFEWIIVDGVSIDGTLDLIKAINDPRVDFISERDSGIYDAMNKGISRARGEYLCFMNADDQFFSESVLADIAAGIQNNTDIEIIYSNFVKVLDENKTEEFKYPFPINFEWLSRSNFCHQATFYRKSLFEKLGRYDVSFKLLADYKWNVQAILSGVKLGFFDSNACYFSLSGAHLLPSNQEIFTEERKQILEILKTAKLTGTIDSKIISKWGRVDQGFKLFRQLKKSYGSHVKNKPDIELNGKRVVVFSDEPGQGGGAHYAHSILLALAKNGAEVFSAQPQWESPLLEEQKSSVIKHVWTAFNPVAEFARSLTDTDDPARILDEVQPDVILFSDCCPVSHVAAKNAAMDRLIPFVTTCHIDAPYLAERFKSVLGQVEKQYAYASEVVAVSSSVLEMLRQKFGLDRSQGRVIYNGRADRFFSPPDVCLRLKLRAEIGVSEDAVLCFTAARMVNEKGHIFQIEAAKRLRDRGKLGNLHFVWAGEGNLSPQLKEIVQKERLDDRFHFLGYRWDIEEWLSAADIFVLTSQLEAFPLCIIEAMAKGLPVVASAVAGVPEEMGDTGALLPDPNKDPQGTVAKLIEVLGQWAGNADIRNQVGALAKERASKLFREEEMCRQTLELISRASALGVQELAVRKMNAMLRSGEANEILKPFRLALEKSSSKEFLENTDMPSFPDEELDSIKSLIQTWTNYPTDESAFGGVRELRRGVASCLVNLNDQSLQGLFSGSFGEVYRLLLGSGVQEYVTEEEESVANALLCGFNENGDFAVARLMASMLFCPAHQTASLLAIEALPNWFRKDFWSYTLSVPQVLTEPEEALRYSNHLLTWLREAVRRIEKEPTSPFTKEIASTLMQFLNVIPSYCTPVGNGELMTLRARVIEFIFGNPGLKLDMPAQPKGHRRAGQRIRVGVLNSHFGVQTETFVTLPALHLDKERFEVHLFCGTKNPGPVEDRSRSLAKGFHLLPESIQERVQMIRNAKLDVLIIGTNITAVTNEIALLAAFRLAPIQVVSHCSPMTSGFKNSDAFLSGSLAYREGLSEAEFSEKLILLDGPPVCLDYSCEPTASGLVPPARSQLGIPADAVIFFNAASCYKIPLELLHLWARLLKEVPNSVLCLLPFNPNWASKLPETRFRALLESVLAEHGVDKNRIVLGPKLPNRAAVMNFERIADVYLDTLPFAGSISTVDPLQLGIPVVACDGETTRSRCSGAQLRELGLDELVGQNEEEYSAKAIHLARDQEYRSGISLRIKEAMSKRPRFLNPEEYGRNLGNALEVLVEEGLGALEDPKAFAQKVRERRSNSTGDSRSKNAEAEITISDAQAAFAEGRLSDAEDICREILGKDERCAGGWNLMGKMAALQGDLETAGEFASVACDLDPQNADFVRDLAEVFFQKKELEPAEEQVRRALEMAPDSPEGLVLLGRILAERDDKHAALEAFQDALRIRKDYAEGFSHYALALQKFGRGKDAISQIRKACALEPDAVEFQTNLAMLLEENARYVDALAAYGKAARMNPNVAFVWFRQGRLLNGLKRYAEAIPVLEKAISLPGQLGEYHYEYGLALHMSKRFHEALAQYEKALSMGYNTAALQCNCGVIYKDLRKGGDAIMAFHAAVNMEPTNVSYLNNLGAAALEIGLNSEALECFEQAVEKNPKLPTARNNIGNLLKDRARGMDALPQYRKSMELNPDDRDVQSNYLLCHMYIPDMDPKVVFEEHKKWGLSTNKNFPPAFKFKPRQAGAKIRVGFLSADLCHHPVAYFIEPIFRGYYRERFEFVAYGDQRKSDEFSARFAKQVDLWHETSSYDDRALAKLIHEDRIDILFELAGHTAYNRLGVFALKPAPVQVSYLGYPGTTGLPTIDFRITDAFADPQGTTEHLHTEKLIRVPDCAWCFEPDSAAPEVEPLPALQNGFVTFGCFNNMAKLNPALFETWAEILLRVPGSHLRLKARTLTDDGVRKELKSYFTERGIEEDRLDFFGHTKKIVEHLGHYHSVDIALDSFPYHGTTTTCEAMWMGCPVVTRAGKAHVSRVGVSLLNAVGLQEFITETREAYIEKAVALAAQTDRLQELRSSMRERLRQSVLMDEKRFVTGFETALMEIATLGGITRP
jgi:predicted O-linked N-acetylglucosamine transferase (SPINDLY family)/glycosyltransferase involved in cell wall biosynthesis